MCTRPTISYAENTRPFPWGGLQPMQQGLYWPVEIDAGVGMSRGFKSGALPSTYFSGRRARAPAYSWSCLAVWVQPLLFCSRIVVLLTPFQ